MRWDGKLWDRYLISKTSLVSKVHSFIFDSSSTISIGLLVDDDELVDEVVDDDVWSSVSLITTIYYVLEREMIWHDEK